MTVNNQKSPLQWLDHWVKETPERGYLHQPIDRKLRVFTWKETQQQVEAIAGALHKLGLSKGDKVAIISKNCAEWFITDLALMRAGMISIPIYPTANAATIDYVLEHSEAKAAFVGKLDNQEETEKGISENIQRISMGYPTIECSHHWQELVDMQAIAPEHEPQLDDLMSIIYTSGSTGKPKGAMIKFSAYAWASYGMSISADFGLESQMLSYLPLAHITERVLVEGVSYCTGIPIYFTESLEHFPEDLRVASPTMFFSVPRLWSLFQQKIIAEIGSAKLNLLLKIPFISSIVKKKIHKALGLQNAVICGSGAAPIPISLLRWYESIGINISEGWGMTENCIYALINIPFDTNKVGTVGKAQPGCEVKLSDEGEVLFKSPGLFSGYYKNEQASIECMTEDGFFKTGDLGKIDEDGAVCIIGRVKDNFKTAKGKFVSPVPIEGNLAKDEHIEQICLIGSGMAAPVAMVQLSEAAQQLGREAVRKSLTSTLQQINKKLESHEVVGGMVVAKDTWTPENGIMTPTLKIKRHVVHEKYSEKMAEVKGGKVAWEEEL